MGLLYQFWTGVCISENSIKGKLIRILPKFIYNKISNRIIADVPSDKIKLFPFLEFKTLWRLKKGKNTEDVFNDRNKRFQELIPDKYLREADVVIGFDTSSWILIERCRKLGKKFILDVSIGHPLAKEEIFNELKNRYPDWDNQIKTKEKKLVEIELKEIALADTIVVPSAFVKNTYKCHGVDESKIFVNPFGTDINHFSAKRYSKIADKKIRFLFFGALTARKGLPLLLEVWTEMANDACELFIAGYGKMPDSFILPKGVTNLGTIGKNERFNLYKQADVFVFPSYFEGFAQVQIEAAACGLPLISTYNAGGEELITNDKNGYLISAGDKNALRISMQKFVNSPELIEKMGQIASEKAKLFTWDSYGNKWSRIIELSAKGVNSFS